MRCVENKGFTLIEVMIVVIIVAVLAAIALPSFISYRRESHDKACCENKAIIVHACTLRQIQRNEIITELSKLSEGDGGLRNEPKCPLGGTYSISYDAATGFDVTCSGGHESETSK